MSNLLRSRRLEVVDPLRWLHFTRIFVLGATIAPLMAILALVRVPFVLPLLSLVAITSAAGIALLAWWMSFERVDNGITLWDLAGLYAFLGCAAAMLAEPAHVTEFLTLPAGGPETMSRTR